MDSSYLLVLRVRDHKDREITKTLHSSSMSQASNIFLFPIVAVEQASLSSPEVANAQQLLGACEHTELRCVALILTMQCACASS